MGVSDQNLLGQACFLVLPAGIERLPCARSCTQWWVLGKPRRSWKILAQVLFLFESPPPHTPWFLDTLRGHSTALEAGGLQLVESCRGFFPSEALPP